MGNYVLCMSMDADTKSNQKFEESKKIVAESKSLLEQVGTKCVEFEDQELYENFLDEYMGEYCPSFNNQESYKEFFDIHFLGVDDYR